MELSAILKDPVWKHTRRKMYFISQDASVREAAKIMKEEGVGSIIALQDSKAVGIIAQRDLINKVLSEGKDPTALKVSSIMSSPLITVGKEESVEKALDLMERNNIRRVVVVDDEGRPYGISVELRICGDLLDRQFGGGARRGRSWLGDYLMEVTEHQLEYAPKMER